MIKISQHDACPFQINRCHRRNKPSCLHTHTVCSQALPKDRNLTIMNEFCPSCICVGSEVESRSLWALTCILPQWWRGRGRLERARKQKKKEIWVFSLLSHVCVCMQYICCIRRWVLFCSLLFVFSGLRWYFCSPRDGSGWTRSATLRGGQVSKKHESKTLWQAKKTERGVWCG